MNGKIIVKNKLQGLKEELSVDYFRLLPIRCLEVQRTTKLTKLPITGQVI
jgi:hypothetical protein